MNNMIKFKNCGGRLKSFSVMLVLIVMPILIVGCSSGQKEFNTLKENSKGDKPYTVEQNIEGKIVEINDNARSVTIAINGDKKYLFEVPEYSLGKNNKGARNADGTYMNKLPSFTIGDRVRIYAGTIQYINPTEGNNRTEPYLIGQENLEIIKIE